MEGLFDGEFSIQSYSKQILQLFQSSSSSSDSNLLSSMLNQQQSIIQKLLESQNFISQALSFAQRYQTTDSQHSQSQTHTFYQLSHFQTPNQFFSNINSTLLNQQKKYKSFKKQLKSLYQDSKSNQPNAQNQNRYIFMHDQSRNKYKAIRKLREEKKEWRKFMRFFMNGLTQFMQKNVTIRQKMKNQLKIEQVEYFSFLENYRREIRSLQDMRRLLRGNSSKSRSMFRKIGNEYLRKHILSRIINKKAQMGNIQLKYRLQLLNILRNQQ